MAMKPNNLIHVFAERPLSFFAFLILSIFFLLSLSTDHLFNNTKFWFCISNALIFVIAADCGAFSPPPTDFHGGGHDRPSINTSPQHNSKIVVTREIPLTTDDIPIEFSSKKSFKRSKSDPKVIQMAQRKKKSAMQIRSKTMMRHDESRMIEKEKKNDQFAQMTNEELNRRVEEFIERFNRKIKFEEMLGHGDEKY